MPRPTKGLTSGAKIRIKIELANKRLFISRHTVKNFVKFVCHKENFRNFVGGEHAIIFCILFVFGYYKDTKISLIAKLSDCYIFIELTL